MISQSSERYFKAVLQSCSQRFLLGKKVGNIGCFLTSFSHKLEHHYDMAAIFVYTKMYAKGHLLYSVYSV